MRDQQGGVRDEARVKVNARGGAYAVCFLTALALHAGLLLGWSRVFPERPEFGIEAGESVEVFLVEAVGEPIPEVAPIPATPAPPSLETEPEPPPLEPQVEPPPPEPSPAEMIQPRPPPVERKPVTTPRPARQAANPTAPAKASPGSALPRSGQAGPAAATGIRTQARPNYLRNPPPPYPAASRQAGEHGIVTLLVSVSEDGRASSVRLKRSSGYSRLDASALSAVQRWRFSPGRVGNVAVASEVEVPVRFKLE